MKVTILKPIRVKSTGETFLPGQVVELPSGKIGEWTEKGLVTCHDTTESPDPTLTRIQQIERATSPDELVQAMSDYIPGQLSDSELTELTRSYELKMSEFMPEEWPETPSGHTLPEASETCLSGQNQGHPEQITPHLAWDGKQVIVLPRCGECQHFKRDTINPSEGLGDCEAFLLPDGKRQIVRYPMQQPKTESCFEREASR